MLKKKRFTHSVEKNAKNLMIYEIRVMKIKYFKFSKSCDKPV